MPVWELLFSLFQALQDQMIGIKYARLRYFVRIRTTMLINNLAHCLGEHTFITSVKLSFIIGVKRSQRPLFDTLKSLT